MAKVHFKPYFTLQLFKKRFYSSVFHLVLEVSRYLFFQIQCAHFYRLSKALLAFEAKAFETALYLLKIEKALHRKIQGF